MKEINMKSLILNTITHNDNAIPLSSNSLKKLLHLSSTSSASKNIKKNGKKQVIIIRITSIVTIKAIAIWFIFNVAVLQIGQIFLVDGDYACMHYSGYEYAKCRVFTEEIVIHDKILCHDMIIKRQQNGYVYN